MCDIYRVAMTVANASRRIRHAVLAWDGVEASAHRFGGIEFRIGRREIGHVHGDWLVDIPFPTRARDEIVAAGLADPHHVLPESGWVSLRVESDADVGRAIALLRKSYELALRQRPGHRPADR